MAVMLEVALLSTATRIWGGLYGFLGDDPILAAVVLLCLALVLAAFLLWIRHWRSEARRLKAFMDPLSAFEEPA